MDTPLPQPLPIDIVSDVVCPWCFLGKRRLERALELVPEIRATLTWRPFRLDPTIPQGGIDRRAYLEGKFGDLAGLEAAHARLVAFGREEGIDFQFDRIGRSPNTIDAHRVVRWASTAGLQDAIVERLFAAYFSEGEDVGDHATLARLAGTVGLDPAAIARRLATDEDRAAVEAEIDEAYRIGVTGVPCFIIDRRYAVMGAQAPETIVGVIRKALAARVPAVP